MDDSGEWCCLRTPTGQTGHVPRRCIEILEEQLSGPERRLVNRTRSKSPEDKKLITSSKRTSTVIRKFKKARETELSESSDAGSIDDNYDGDYPRQSTHSRHGKHQSCASCCDNRHNHHSVSPPPPARQEQLPIVSGQQYQAMNVQPLQQRQTGQPIIHQGANGQPSVIVVPSASNQSAAPRPPPVCHFNQIS